jgi:wyosine [tRNA(Phe)-imidazoG37] synthetase (radical SAM superfamily)
MENVPWHEEVIYFVKKLVERLPDYDISCEHEHSNCLLITHKKVSKDSLISDKGQLISKCPYEKSVSSKIPTNIFLDFCSENFCSFLGASW